MKLLALLLVLATQGCLWFEGVYGYATELRAYERCIERCYDRGLTDCGCRRPSED